MKLLAIDPGTYRSAYVSIDIKTYKPLLFDIVENDLIFDIIQTESVTSDFKENKNHFVIERVQSYGMKVGQEIFDTVFWAGRFYDRALAKAFACVDDMPRKNVKLNICGSMRTNDSRIRTALIKRFGIVGTKSSPGYFYGFNADIWQAYALGVTYIDYLKDTSFQKVIK